MSDRQSRPQDDDLAYGQDYTTTRGYNDHQGSADRGIIGDALRKIKSKYDDRQRPQQDYGYGGSSTSPQPYNQSNYTATHPQNQPAYVGAPPPQQPQQPGSKPDLAGKLFNTLQSTVHSIGSDVAGLIGPKYDSQNTHGPGLQSNLQSQSTAQPGDRFRFESTFPGPKPDNQVKWYVDGCNYMWAVSLALESARESIWILDWWLTPELYLRRPPARNEEWRLDRVLQRAANRGVKVNIIVYKEVTQVLTLSSSHTKHALEALSPNIGVFRHPDHLPDAQTAHSSIVSALQGLKLDAAGASKLGADALKGVYGISDDVILYWAHHEKMCLIDGQMAFMGGLDLCFGRWDTNQHPISDAHPSDLNKIIFPGQDYNNARVMDFNEVDKPFQNKLDRTKSSRMGWSDISICLRGPCIEDLRYHFTTRWNFIYDEKYNVRRDKRYSRLPPIHGQFAAPLPQVPSNRPPQQNLQPGQYPPPPGQGSYTQPPWQSTSRPHTPTGPGTLTAQPAWQSTSRPHTPTDPNTIPAQPYGQVQSPSLTTTAQYQPSYPPPPPQQASQQSTYYPPPPQAQQFGQQPTSYPPPPNQPQGSYAPTSYSTTQQPGYVTSASSGPPPQQISYPPPPSGGPPQIVQPTQHAEHYVQQGSYAAPQPSQGYQGSATELPASQTGYQPYNPTQGSRGFNDQEPYSSQYSGQERGFDSRDDHDTDRGYSSRGGRFDQYRDQGKRLGSELSSIGNMVEGRLRNEVSTYTGRYSKPSSRPSSRGGPSMSCQLVRSCTKWSNGTPTEHSIQNAYIDLIKKSQHFIYIENQFFITATGDKQKPVQNLVGKALVDRILVAARNRQPFKIIVVIPAVPAFAGDLQDDAALGTRAIMEFQYSSICRGGHSIMEEVARAGYNPMDYIRFYNLRNYDRINTGSLMQSVEQQSGVRYDDARRQYDDRLGAGYGGQGETQPYGAPGQQQQQYQAAAQAIKTTAADQWDSVSSCYMLGGEDIRNVPWNGPPEAELDAFVSEELYIHSKVMIVDDRLVICGSANLNDRSMLGSHDSEIALVISDPTPIQSSMAGRPWDASRFASSLRRQLFRKHLGLLPPQDMQRPNANFEPVTSPNAYDWGSPQDNIVSDPLSDTFQSLWNTRARTNTDIFRKAFRAVPDDNVRSWAEYKEFFEYYFAKAEDQAGGKDKDRKPARVEYGHVVRNDFPGGIREFKDLLAQVKGTLVEMPLCFLQDEDIAKIGLSFNALTAEIYT